MSCVIQEIGAGHTTCSVADQACICNDHVLSGYVQECAMANCTVKELLVAQNATLATCGVAPSQQDTVMRWFRAVLFGLPTFFIVVRMINKYMKLSTWWWDDWTILIAYILLAAFLPAAYLAEETGAGRDIWTLTPSQITNFLLLFYVFGLLYMACLGAIKASILFLYLRIFPDERFRKILWCTQVFNLLLVVAFVATTIGSCQPVNFFWNGWAGEMKGKCINLNAFAMCHGVLNVALDVWMLILPATQVWHLKMQWQRKLGVMLMFGVGVFLTAVSAYRIRTLLLFATSYNVTADSFQSSLWSHIELCVGIFVACLPSTRQLWRIIFPKLVEVTHLSRSGRSGKGSKSESQASRTISSPPERRRGSYEDSSIAHLVGDFSRIGLSDTHSEPDSPFTPKALKNDYELKESPQSSSSRGG
nr:CFEM domain-containing protein [Colletotrichum truncatum]KAF6792887.1 CFEM domain-containing protein [Colletotrichum truncatum]